MIIENIDERIDVRIHLLDQQESTTDLAQPHLDLKFYQFFLTIIIII